MVALQNSIQVLPKGIITINNCVAYIQDNDQIVFYTASGPIYSCSKKNDFEFRLAQALIVKMTSVTAAEFAKAFEINRSTVSRNFNKYENGGITALIKDTSNRVPYKLDDKKVKIVQALLNKGCTLKAAAKEVDVSEGCIRYAIRNGRIIKENFEKIPQADLKSASTRSEEDNNCLFGTGTKRIVDRVLAIKGLLDEAKPEFSSNEGVRYAGILIALPILSKLGFIEAGEKIYKKIQNGFYGLRSILLTLAFMALLRIKTPEQLKGKSPGELGIVLGLDRVPEVKTLRTKLNEIGLCNKASDFMAFLTNKWIEMDEDTIGYAYIDGHVRPYHGLKNKLPKTHVARRRLCMPATSDFWVNDSNCEPLFFVTAEANDSLLSVLDSSIIPELKTHANKDERVTLIFDREGWSPKSFKKWFDNGIDVITYRKGKQYPWPKECFIKTESQIRGKKNRIFTWRTKYKAKASWNMVS